MKLSAPTRYAIRILFELSECSHKATLGWISERTGISFKVVEAIAATLRQHGITASSAGPRGGISLVAPLAEISLGQVILLFDEGVEFAVCCGDKSNDCPQQNVCETRAMWRGISGRIQAELDKISLAEVLRNSPQIIVPLRQRQGQLHNRATSVTTKVKP